MPQVRAKNDRSGIYDLGDHHDYSAPNIPAPRRVPAPDFCQMNQKMELSVKHNYTSVRMAGKAVVRKQTSDNIEKLTKAKSNLAEAKEMLFNHILTCETCSKGE
ncbi:hypothetical protein SEA_COMRADE_228 [Streptomyces phage Comrade]|uniref:Uncharacterized protein n=1 Tax=Streptomyces phage Comrade TaxID=2301714 RepID=A0A385DVF4_9CAUD|nr:hypothetical protein HWB84_gp050 [Streptomyces phage Comrade]AXQ63463.1 hypothetical protein SEA_COMRADE_228 [Streptomyces phage Comrade]